MTETKKKAALDEVSRGRLEALSEIHLDGLQRLGIGAEGLKIHIPRKFVDFSDCIQDILDALFPIPRRHGGILPSRAHEYGV